MKEYTDNLFNIYFESKQKEIFEEEYLLESIVKYLRINIRN